VTDSELSRTSVTFKTGEKYKESLINFSGAREQVRADVIAFFGLVPSECDGRTDYEVRLMADSIAQSVAVVQNKLGAVLATKSEVAAGNAQAQPRDQIPQAVHDAMANGDPWKQAGEADTTAAAKPEAPAPSPVEVMLDTVDAQVEVKALQLVWAQNKQLFKDHDELMAAYKAKGKSLQAAA
jgi:hypothetical protein